jgi:WD40 repeat protein
MAATTGSANIHPQHKKCTSPSVTAFSLQTPVPQTSNASHRLVAVTEGSSASLLKVVRVDCISRVCKEVSSHSFKQLQFPTDVSWSLLDPERLVVSFKSGSISCFNVLAVKTRSQTYGLAEEWSSGNVSTGINRIVWHPSDRNTLAAATQDGTIKIFDCRCFKRDGRPNASTASSPSSTVTCGRRLTQAARDVAFSPFQSHYIAEV